MIEYAENDQLEMTREERVAAAAPELLAALKAIIKAVGPTNDGGDGTLLAGYGKPLYPDARAAIAKAEGLR